MPSGGVADTARMARVVVLVAAMRGIVHTDEAAPITLGQAPRGRPGLQLPGRGDRSAAARATALAGRAGKISPIGQSQGGDVRVAELAGDGCCRRGSARSAGAARQRAGATRSGAGAASTRTRFA